MTAEDSSIRRWKLALGTLVGLFLIGMAISFTLAARKVTRVVDRDYYTHGLQYGQCLPTADWTIAPYVQKGYLVARVVDSGGGLLRGGRLQFEPEEEDRSRAAALAFAESSPGVFKSTAPLPPNTELHGTLRFIRGEANTCRKVVLFN
ncbi:hypothetical protein L4X63_12240 [Geomonas sp. Red32]|uniref:hypothetical protein n=1 Tax=Geomonas sp. Red32 TaxID=2912856 RepID=UPI00202D02C5|nr:hypothetical protein [Geomonas sp. Red32]MCM0082358.1 hypothetical protein [Geomonas sp. Red32]